jgi:NAD(P)-dependent dehydrogenase (short-subunit alcohol dehydrogenase family)
VNSERVAVIAGVGPGTGRQVAIALAEQYQHVVLIARNADRLDEVAREIQTRTRRAHCLPVDLTDEGACADAVKTLDGLFEGVDTFIHNAFSRPPTGSLANRSAEDWYRAVDGNILSATNMMYGLRPMLGPREGSIVLVSSISARQPYEPSGIYAAMKAAMLTLIKVFAKELGRDGIRINAVVPGYIEGPNLEPYFAEVAKQKGITAVEARQMGTADTCLGRFVSPREVANAITFFAGPMSRGITGQTLDVNAGQWFG